MSNKISSRLLHLLYETKHKHANDTRSNKQIVIEALGDLYSRDMTMSVMLNHCVKACLEIQNIPEFQRYYPEQKSEFVITVLMSPYFNYNSNKTKRLYPDPKDQITIEEMFENMLAELLSYIRLTNIGWSDQYKNYRESKYQNSNIS